MAAVTLYTRKGCHLCEEAKAVLLAAQGQAEFELDIVDIDGTPALRRLYDWEVPVIAVDGKKAFKYRVTLPEFLKKLEARS